MKTWILYRCSAGSQWSSAYERAQDGSVCNFSGCNCNTRVRQVKVTDDGREASAWFARPNKDNLVTIHVRAQAEPKQIESNTEVGINRMLPGIKKVGDLVPGDEFLLDGAWYEVTLIYKKRVEAAAK